ncbi:MAG: hypothetical protein J3Q66DRAFT_430250 [Benniella sp.]|nr:MAG: hypothetical protein J3Q66DRAFT_430250 [Benniella sp.]
MEWAITRFLVGTLRRFSGRSQIADITHQQNNTMTDESHQQPSQAIALQNTRASMELKTSSSGTFRPSNLLDEGGGIALDSIKPLQPVRLWNTLVPSPQPLWSSYAMSAIHQSQSHVPKNSDTSDLIDLQDQLPSKSVYQLTRSIADLHIVSECSQSPRSHGQATIAIGSYPRTMPVHLSHKQLILKEISLRKSTFQVLALLDIIDMKELLNCKIQNYHPIQSGCDLSEEATTKDETYGSRFAHQLLNMGKPREAILLIARVLKERNKELDHKAIPYLIELMDPGLTSEFVGDYYGVCATVLEAIESQLYIQLGDLHQGKDPKAQIHLAKIAFSLIMGFDLEVELDTRFPAIKFVAKYNDIMALLDRSFASQNGQDRWLFLSAVESMIRDDPMLLKMTVVHCFQQEAITKDDSFIRAAVYLARKLNLERELYEWVRQPSTPLTPTVSFGGPIQESSHSPHQPSSSPLTLPPESASSGLTAATSPSPTSSRASTLIMEPTAFSTNNQGAPLPSDMPQPKTLCQVYTLPLTTKVVLVNQANQLGHLERALHHSSVVSMSSIQVNDTCRLPSRRSNRYLSRSQAQCIPRYLLHSPYHRTQSSERQYQTAGQRIPHRKTPSMTTLLQLACDADDCVYVVDTTTFLEDRTNQLPRVIGRFFSNKRIRKIVFKWSRERSILEYTFPFLKQQENQLVNVLDLGRVWCRFVPPPHLIDQGHCHDQGYAAKNAAIAISTNTVTHPESYASLAGDVVPWARYTVEFWSMRPQSVPMTCLQFAGPNVALKKLCGKQLAPGFRCIDWTNRPLTAEQVNHAAAAAYSLRSIYEVLSNRPFIA